MATITLQGVQCLTFEYSPWPVGMAAAVTAPSLLVGLLTPLLHSPNTFFCSSDAVFIMVHLCFAPQMTFLGLPM